MSNLFREPDTIIECRYLPALDSYLSEDEGFNRMIVELFVSFVSKALPNRFLKMLFADDASVFVKESDVMVTFRLESDPLVFSYKYYVLSDLLFAYSKKCQYISYRMAAAYL